MITVAGALLAAGIFSVSPVGAESLGPAGAASKPRLAPEAAAVAEARASGVPVEVSSWTTETERVLANPSGSFTSELSAGPVRVRKGDGWVPVDTTLRRDTDGSVRPVAVVADVVLSAGGSMPLARVARNGVSLSLKWPGPLPVPTLNGDSATYAEVLPGVDLLVRAHVDGFSEVLVVKTAEAAALPELRRIELGAEATGGSLRTTPTGGFSVVDAWDNEVLTSPEPLMWDSKGGPDAGGVAAMRAIADRAHGPRQGDQTAPIDVEVSDGALTLVPDANLLRSPHFPLYLDPWVSAPRLARAMVNGSFPGQEYPNWSNATHEGVGWTNKEGTHTKRLFWRFDTRGIIGKTILKAEFAAYEVWADSCAKSTVVLGMTNGFSAATNWSNQPAWLGQVATATVAHGRPGCSSAGAWVEFDARAAAVNASLKRWSWTTLSLRAATESNASGWKRFRHDASLSIEYNTPPAVPTGLRTTSPVTACATGAARPSIPNDPPILTARLNDADGAKGQSVRARFELFRTNGPRLAAFDTPFKGPGLDFTWPLSSLAAGTYTWRVKAHDGQVESAFSRLCEFTVDTTKPPSPAISVPDGQVYAVGRRVSFTFSPNGATDVHHFKWSLKDAPTSADVPASAPTATVYLPSFGLQVLRVWSYDKAGNVSLQPGTFEFMVEGGLPVGHWLLDEHDGQATLADAVSPGHPLTPAGGTEPAWGRCYTGDPGDPTDWARRFDGTSGVAYSAPGDIVRTDDNFSVSAWVRVPDVSENRVAVSQGSATSRGFTLGTLPAGTDEDGNKLARFAFTLPNPDPAAAETANVSAQSDTLAVVGEWVHLVGVYEVETGLVSLWVNRELVAQGEASFRAGNEPAALRLGRAQTSAAAAQFWKGDIDDLYVFKGALDRGQVTELFADYRPK